MGEDLEFEIDDGGAGSALEDLEGQLKLLVSHIQIFGGLAGAITLSWPAVMYDAKSLASSLDFDFSSLVAIQVAHTTLLAT